MATLEMIEDRENIQPLSMDYEPIEGVFKAIISSSEVVPTRAGDGLMLKLQHTIVEGEHTNRKLFTQLNIKNPSAKAQTIGLGILSSISKACGFKGIPANSEDLHNREHMIKVKIVPGSGLNPSTGEPYGPKSEVKSYSPILDIKPGVLSPSTVAADEELPDFMK